MIHVQPPSRITLDDYSKFKIFLAGSIDMGRAENWQQRISDRLVNEDAVIFNPRGNSFDPELQQEINNIPFYNQVKWEIDHLELADLIIYFFSPDGMAPITLLELGLFADRIKKGEKQALVYCRRPYWRKGNVDILCDQYKIHTVENEGELITNILWKIQSYQKEQS